MCYAPQQQGGARGFANNTVMRYAYEHMNKGDLAVEKNDMKLAMDEYNAAMKMFPENLEMKYWTAVALANKGMMKEAIPMFKEIFKKDKN